ncbi:hypothetical protein BDZ45DRAFT_687646 [Acephala macrosclerotiorum]|nr:hypothetical protein BDZ45DRAFT_687646 [Acephala macrosclerotiorum]
MATQGSQDPRSGKGSSSKSTDQSIPHQFIFVGQEPKYGAQQHQGTESKIFPTVKQCIDKYLLDSELARSPLEFRPVPPFELEPNTIMPTPAYRPAGYVYPFPLEELVRACKDFPLDRWQEWCNVPTTEAFLSWMLDEMGATMALFGEDEVKPFLGIGSQSADKIAQEHYSKLAE